MKLSLCLDMLFTDRPFGKRIEAASDCGYRAFEFWDWRDKPIEEGLQRSRACGLSVAAMSGNRRHALIDPAARAGLVAEMRDVLDVAARLSCRNIMMLSDVLASDGSAATVSPMTRNQKIDSVVQGLRALSPPAEAAGATLLLEPLNTRLDHRGCFLDSSDLAVEIVRRVESPQVKILYDIYHMHMMSEDVLRNIEKHRAWIGYIHVADSPGRHQPGTGDIDWPAVAKLLHELEYEGFVGMEFVPQGPSFEAAKAPLEFFGRFVNA
jgi:hydroxypyruvate isomerase